MGFKGRMDDLRDKLAILIDRSGWTFGDVLYCHLFTVGLLHKSSGGFEGERRGSLNGRVYFNEKRFFIVASVK